MPPIVAFATRRVQAAHTHTAVDDYEMILKIVILYDMPIINH